MVEHILGKDEVIGSIPICSSKFAKANLILRMRRIGASEGPEFAKANLILRMRRIGASEGPEFAKANLILKNRRIGGFEGPEFAIANLILKNRRIGGFEGPDDKNGFECYRSKRRSFASPKVLLFVALYGLLRIDFASQNRRHLWQRKRL